MSLIPSSSDNNTPTEVTLASFWKRLFPWVYDLLGAFGIFIFALAIGQIVLYLVSLPFVDDFAPISQAASQNFLWGLYLFAAVQYYYVWCWVKGGQTVGMKAWKLQLYKVDGKLLNWKEAYLRSFASLGGISNLWSLVDSEKRGLHDLIFDTRVVELPKGFYKKHIEDSGN
jgi:uncharacterized RDD family membrane protein YckC